MSNGDIFSMINNFHNRIHKLSLSFILLCFVAMSLSGCYHTKYGHKASQNARTYNNVSCEQTQDSDTTSVDNNEEFLRTHHYAQNYNFVVKADSVVLLRQQPEELLNNLPTDSFVVAHGDHLVVVDIRMLKNDHVDSVWIQVARDQYTFGWIHESKLLASVVPDDPISQFISTFSDTHLLIFLIVISGIAASYMLYSIRQRRAKVVHFNDIDSFYPSLLALTVATAATFYSSIQMFAPDTWRNFYFHPSLNPFSVPPIISIFLASVWAMVIMAIATVDDIYHKLPSAHATLYLSGLCAVCAANYIIFSISTLYYIGYILLILYFIFSIRQYIRNNFYRYVCGNCGAKMKDKGICPKCGAVNN